MPLVRLILGMASLLACVACDRAAGSTKLIEVTISVRADRSVPLSGVPVRVDGDLAGRTDRAGLLRIELASSLRREVRLEPICPEGYRQPDRPSVLRLLSYTGEDAHSGLELELTCRPARRRAVFIVRAIGAPGIPIRLDGDVVERTNRDGVAHFSRSALPGTEYLVELDAAEHPELLPRRTAHRFELPDRDELFVVEQKFEPGRPARKSRVLPRPRIIRIE